MHLTPGRPSPLGATYLRDGTNFALWAPSAERVELCLHDDVGVEQRRLDLVDRTHGVWHGLVGGVAPGRRYGFRVHGPWDPAHGQRFNAAKLLVDPYARAITGQLDHHDAIFGHRVAGARSEPDVRDERDSAPHVPQAVVTGNEPDFDWGNDKPPRTAYAKTVIYEAHVRGLTKLHPQVPDHQRGTYAGLAHPAVIDYLKDLGVTAVELLPVHHHVTEPVITARGLTNYWGYNTLGYFAPHAAYSANGSTGGQVTEFKTMVKALHAAGLEVLLDVVYNHTCEGGVDGPTLSWRGIDNAAYYRLRGRGRRYADFTGCGNTIKTQHPHVVQMIMDSLRYWVTEMRVDGFRFDLATVLARGAGGNVEMWGSLMTAISQDPVLREVKLIAEPWDVGPGGYQVGHFPELWCEWNDKFRDTVRAFWRGEPGALRDLGYRLSGSSDLYADDGRRPYASINFVTAHDGFALRDTVSYECKHNEANREDNRDGHDHNLSSGYGAEGETDNSEIVAVRQRQARNLLLTLLLSPGVPMLTAGDERGRTQRGNNNAYCHDDPLTWVSWDASGSGADADGFGAGWSGLLPFAAQLLRLRREHPVLRQRHFFAGRPVIDGGPKDLTWYSVDGTEMTAEDWHADHTLTVGMALSGDALRARLPDGSRPRDVSYLLWLHAGPDPVTVTLPKIEGVDSYEVVVDTTDPNSDYGRYLCGTGVTLVGRSALLLEM